MGTLVRAIVIALAPFATALVATGGLAVAAPEGTAPVATDRAGSARAPDASGRSGTAAGWLRIPDGSRARYAEEIRETARRHDVSTALVEAVIQVESAFNPLAVSPKGARGLMQLMPRTASALGVQDAFDPRQNIEGGVRHLRHLIDRYAGDLARALAAYNAGEGAVEYYRGIPPYPETRRYVEKVLDRHRSGAIRHEERPAVEAAATPPEPADPTPSGATIARRPGELLPELPLVDDARRTGRLLRATDGVERPALEPVAHVLARMRQQSALR